MNYIVSAPSQITLDNQGHSGMVKLFMDIDSKSSACNDWRISGTGRTGAFWCMTCRTGTVMCRTDGAVRCRTGMAGTLWSRAGTFMCRIDSAGALRCRTSRTGALMCRKGALRCRTHRAGALRCSVGELRCRIGRAEARCWT